VALTEVLKLSKEQTVKIHTDSKYPFLILHAHAAIWKERGMLTITETVSYRDKREITLIVLGITALIGALAGISYGVIADHITTKKT
jgi:ribonuclease HI